MLGDILSKDFDCNFREVAAADQVNEVKSSKLSHIKHTLIMLIQDRGCFSWIMPRCPRSSKEEQDLATRSSAGREGEWVKSGQEIFHVSTAGRD